MGMVFLWDCKSSGNPGMKRRCSIRQIDTNGRHVGASGTQMSRALVGTALPLRMFWHFTCETPQNVTDPFGGIILFCEYNLCRFFRFPHPPDHVCIGL